MVIKFSGNIIEYSGNIIEFSGNVIEFSANIIEFSGIVIEFRWIFIEFRWMVIEYRAIWSKQSPPNTILQSFLYSAKLQLISMKCHRIQWNCHRIQWNCHRIRMYGHRNQSKLVETITSKHYFTLTPIFCHIGKVFIKTQSPPNTISHSPKHFKPSQAKSVREKKGWPSFENSMNGHFSARGIAP